MILSRTEELNSLYENEGSFRKKFPSNSYRKLKKRERNFSKSFSRIFCKYSTFKNTERADKETQFVNDFSSAYYIRLAVADNTGALAKITGIFAKCGISIVEVAQRGQKADENARIPVIVITHQTTENRVKKAVEKINQSEMATVKAVIRVEQ